MFDCSDLFKKKKLDAGELTDYHPMVLSMKQGLEQARKRIDVAPIKVSLPIKVQNSVDSRKKWGVKRDDGTHRCLSLILRD